MDANERLEYMSEAFEKEMGLPSPVKDRAMAANMPDEADVHGKWERWVEIFYSELFDLHKAHNIK